MKITNISPGVKSYTPPKKIAFKGYEVSGRVYFGTGGYFITKGGPEEVLGEHARVKKITTIKHPFQNNSYIADFTMYVADIGEIVNRNMLDVNYLAEYVKPEPPSLSEVEASYIERNMKKFTFMNAIEYLRAKSEQHGLSDTETEKFEAFKEAETMRKTIQKIFDGSEPAVTLSASDCLEHIKELYSRNQLNEI